jgi:hypothetical protein
MDMSGRYRFTQVYRAPGKNLLETVVASVPKEFVMVTCIAFAIDKLGDPAPMYQER